MKAVVVMAAVLLIGALRPEPAHAWATANRWGGSTAILGALPAIQTPGVAAPAMLTVWAPSTLTCTVAVRPMPGTAGPNTRTLTAAVRTARIGAGATHTYASGATAYHPPAYGYHPPGYGYGYPAYHPPVAVPYYSASGCLGCAVAAGAVVGATAGAVAALRPPTRRQPTRPDTRPAARRDMPWA